MRNKPRVYEYKGQKFEVLELEFGRIRVSDGLNSIRIRSGFINTKSIVLVEDIYQQYFTEEDTIEKAVQSACNKLINGRAFQRSYQRSVSEFVNSLPEA